MLILSFSTFGIFFLSIYFGAFGRLPNEKEIALLKNPSASIVYSEDGIAMAKIFKINREDITYENIPVHTINALIATEDARYFEHSGIDYLSWVRVFLRTILLGDKSSGGGSTLSQQLVKNIYGRSHYPHFSMAINKLKEAITAQRIETIYSKEEVLTLYLNTVSFGEDIYGISTASRRYFNKNTQDLKIEESAVLIGILKANTTYNPRINPEKSLSRRNIVIDQMLKYGYLKKDEAEQIKSTPLNLNYQNLTLEIKAGYFIKQVEKYAKKVVDLYNSKNDKEYNLYTDGLIIETTLDYKLQQLAEKSLYNQVEKLQAEFNSEIKNNPHLGKKSEHILNQVRKTKEYTRLRTIGYNEKVIIDSLSKINNIYFSGIKGFSNEKASLIDSIIYAESRIHGAVLSVDPQNKEVKAWVGGINYTSFPYDNIQSKRQIGSVIKPFIYYSALEKGFTPCDYILNREKIYTDYDNWKPSNSNGETGGKYSMKGGLTHSVNLVSVEWLLLVGIDKFIANLHRMGIEQEIEPIPSIALGTLELSLMEVAKMYSFFLSEDSISNFSIIRSIRTKEGTILYEKDDTSSSYTQDLNQRLITEFLQGVIQNGTGQRLNSYKIAGDIAGKTGTTQDGGDGWFAGFSPKLVTITWMGSSHQKIHFRSGSKAQGAYLALPVWGKLYENISSYPELKQKYTGEFRDLTPKESSFIDCPDFKKDNLIDKLFDPFRSKKLDKEKMDRKEKKRSILDRIFNRETNTNQ
ncbi:MAG: transglycosylase domain-containing protein [Cyclobacteriaceae bacterium]|nr:transglycosylase domain-containing protein [Cyclobacteriaceae bacterium]